MVEHDGGRLLVDCGPGVLGRLREREGWPHVDAVAITHFHLDHWGDLVPVGLGRDVPRRRRLDRRAARAVGARGRPGAARAVRGAIRLLRTCSTASSPCASTRPRRPFAAAGIDVTPMRLPHYRLETYGFRLAANGKTIAYSGDSGPSERLAELARDTDLFVCEATLLNGEDDGLPRGHLSVEEALAAAAASGTRRVLLTHRPAELPGAGRDRARLRRSGARAVALRAARARWVGRGGPSAVTLAGPACRLAVPAQAGDVVRGTQTLLSGETERGMDRPLRAFSGCCRR